MFLLERSQCSVVSQNVHRLAAEANLHAGPLSGLFCQEQQVTEEWLLLLWHWRQHMDSPKRRHVRWWRTQTRVRPPGTHFIWIYAHIPPGGSLVQVYDEQFSISQVFGQTVCLSLSLRCAWTLRNTWFTLLVVGFWRVMAAWMTAGRQNLSSVGFTHITVKLAAGVCSEKTRVTPGRRTSSPASDTACSSTRSVSLVMTHKVLWAATQICCTLTSYFW